MYSRAPPPNLCPSVLVQPVKVISGWSTQLGAAGWAAAGGFAAFGAVWAVAGRTPAIAISAAAAKVIGRRLRPRHISAKVSIERVRPRVLFSAISIIRPALEIARSTLSLCSGMNLKGSLAEIGGPRRGKATTD